MAPTAIQISAAEYDRLYAHQSGWEYWFGEARRKPVPTKLHSTLQLLLGQLLLEAGYIAATELELRIIPDWHPRPDASGSLQYSDEPYPTRPIDVIFEVLSDGEDREEKGRLYSQIGIPQMFYFNPMNQTISEWKSGNFVEVADVQLVNGVTITGRTIWLEMRRRKRAQEPLRKVI